MKFGILMHKHTQNIGDDIQSYAAARLLPSVDYFLDREKLDSFETDDGKPAAVVMSAWYMWHKWNWPPSEYIVPLFVGMHYADHELAKQDGSPVKTEFLTGIGRDYLNAYGPVGCRDSFTEKSFRDTGIDAYFSGCITLTLPNMPRIKPEKEYVCCVDVSKAVVEKTRSLLDGTDIELREIKHYHDYRNSTDTWEQRTKNVTDLLTIYQNAKCVVTRRLHCALPCLAMGVPVLLINNEKPGADIRFEPYYDWLFNCTREAYINGEFAYDITNPPENSKDHLPYREALLKAVSEFVEKYKDAEGTVKDFSKITYTREELKDWQHKTMKSCMDSWLYVTRDHINTNSKLEKKLASSEKKLSETSDKLKKTSSELSSEQKKSEELKKQNEQLKKQLKELSDKNKSTETELEKLKKIVSCRSVVYGVKVRNAFMKKEKKINIDKYTKK